MKNIICIAKKCGAVNGSGWAATAPGSNSIIFKDENQLRATVEQVAGPLVDKLTELEKWAHL